MIEKWIKPGGDGARAIGYLTGDTDHAGRKRPVPPVVLAGDVELFGAVLETIRSQRTYASNVLSFERVVSPEIEGAALRQFPEALLPGLHHRVPSLWVRHVDHERTELHNLWARIVLPTGRIIEPYFHRRDVKRIRAWRDSFNLVYGLSSPDDPARARLSAPPRRGSDHPLRSVLVDLCESAVLAGRATSRLQLVELLNQYGHTVEERPRYLRVVGPTFGTGLRLEGGIFERQWRPGIGTKEDRKIAIEQYQQHQKQRRIDLNAELINRIEGYRKWLTKRYGTVEMIDFGTFAEQRTVPRNRHVKHQGSREAMETLIQTRGTAHPTLHTQVMGDEFINMDTFR